MKKEFILCAAINFNCIIICGHRHSDCYITLINLLVKWPKQEHLPCREKQGFLTSKNRFVDRKEAYLIALEANQIKPTETKILISEDLY